MKGACNPVVDMVVSGEIGDHRLDAVRENGDGDASLDSGTLLRGAHRIRLSLSALLPSGLGSHSRFPGAGCFPADESIGDVCRVELAVFSQTSCDAERHLCIVGDRPRRLAMCPEDDQGDGIESRTCSTAAAARKTVSSSK